ncbi:ParB/RepB/Spo0J family partition protein [Roseibium salinum]|nr:ParB/RepB/Spo0J family partition protein [Roseibium salinum]
MPRRRLRKNKSAQKPAPEQKVTAPVVNSMGRALSHMREDSIVSLDPSKIDPSPYADRFETDEEAAEALEELKLSIQDEGQKIPVLVRPHPSETGRYQLAYGHRRLFAIQALMSASSKPETVKVKAYVRKLSDTELIKEQSLENGVRENLTFAEMALWAVQLRQAGLKQREMQPVLGQVPTVISNMLKVADSIPPDIIRAIGRARNVGRPAWMDFCKAVRRSERGTPHSRCHGNAGVQSRFRAGADGDGHQGRARHGQKAGGENKNRRDRPERKHRCQDEDDRIGNDHFHSNGRDGVRKLAGGKPG